MVAQPAVRRWLPAVLAGLAVLLCAGWVAADVADHQNVVSSTAQDLTTAVALAGLGLLIARRQPGNPIGWLVLAGAVGLPLTSGAIPYVALAYRREHRWPFA